MDKTIHIGLIGLGTVGSGVVKILRSEAAAIEEKTGVRLVLKKVCVKSTGKKRAVNVPRHLLTTKPEDILNDESIDVVVELIGGVRPAKDIILKAFAKGKHVVTANKALLAEHADEIFRDASRLGRFLGIEASVCGGIPVIQAIKSGLASNNITQILGIVNGTCNYILTDMSSGKVAFSAALADAQSKGYAEKNPALDIDGVDSAHKLAILARLAFRVKVPFEKIHVEGIRRLSAADIEYARELGYVVKLLAVAKKWQGGLELRVHPTMLPLDHPLSSVRGVYNAIFLNGDQAGNQLFYGRGAGMLPTASAVMGDIIEIALRLTGEAEPRPTEPRTIPVASVYPIGATAGKFYLRFQVVDKPGVLGRIAHTLGKNGISILSVHQKESHNPKSTPVIILTYEAAEKDARKALRQIDSSKDVSEMTTLIRVEK